VTCRLVFVLVLLAHDQRRIRHVAVTTHPKRRRRPSRCAKRVRDSILSNVATCGYNLLVTSTGIRELKDNLSRYIRRIEAGERIAITSHGRVVAELVPPGAKAKGTPSRFDELVASGVIRPPLEAGDPTEGWPDIRLPAGTAAELIDADRGEA
jgi:prevent-host-death family protein